MADTSAKSIKVKRYSQSAVTERIKALQEGLDLKSLEAKNINLTKMLAETRELDNKAIEELIKKEGEMIAQQDFVYTIEDQILSKQSIRAIRKYKDVQSDEWKFITNEERVLIDNTARLIKKAHLEFELQKADLMIMRKEVIDFVTHRLNKIKSDKKPQDIINLIINNYSYLDTLRELGYNKNEEGEFIPYVLNNKLEYSSSSVS